MRHPSGGPLRLFVSYAHVDAVFVAEFATRLESAEFELWWDDRLKLGEDWKARLRAQIAQCSAFVCVISPDFRASEWCTWELQQAVSLSRCILPIVARKGSELPAAIRGLQCLDLSDGLAVHNVDALVGRLRSLQQCGALDGDFSPDAPVGLPSRFIQPLPERYRTVAQAYLRPASPGMHLKTWVDPKREASPDRRVVGIDFGTTTCAVACFSEGAVRLIPNARGDSTTPSAVAIGFDGTPLVGRSALDFLLQRPERGVVEPKRLLGHQIAQHFGGAVVLEVDGVSYRPEDLAALVLRQLRSDVAAFFSADVRKAVLSAPAYFDPSQHAALSESARLAGWEVQRIIAEPVAACYVGRVDRDGTVLIYDLGGGTFDVSVVDADDGVLEVKSVSGDTALGGVDLDRVIVDYCVDAFAAHTGVDLRNDGAALLRIRDAAERAKIDLSSVTETRVSVPFITAVRGQPLHLDIGLTRARYHELTHALVARTIQLTREALDDAGRQASDVSVLVVGRAARAPSVRWALEDLFGRRLPISSDDIVARGAAIQAGVLAGTVKDVLLLDVTAHALRVQVAGNRSVSVLPRHAAFPTKRRTCFIAPVGETPTILVRVLGGESSWPARNVPLLQFEIPNVTQRSNERSRICLVFDIDANGILLVTAGDEQGAPMGHGQVGLRAAVPANVTPGTRDGSRMVLESSLPSEEDPWILTPLRHSAFSDVRAVQRWLAENAVTREAKNLQTIIAKDPATALAPKQRLAVVEEFAAWLRQNAGVNRAIEEWRPDCSAELVDLIGHRFGTELPVVRRPQSIAAMAEEVRLLNL